MAPGWESGEWQHGETTVRWKIHEDGGERSRCLRSLLQLFYSWSVNPVLSPELLKDMKRKAGIHSQAWQRCITLMWCVFKDFFTLIVTSILTKTAHFLKQSRLPEQHKRALIVRQRETRGSNAAIIKVISLKSFELNFRWISNQSFFKNIPF